MAPSFSPSSAGWGVGLGRGRVGDSSRFGFSSDALGNDHEALTICDPIARASSLGSLPRAAVRSAHGWVVMGGGRLVGAWRSDARAVDAFVARVARFVSGIYYYARGPKQSMLEHTPAIELTKLQLMDWLEPKTDVARYARERALGRSLCAVPCSLSR